ncbi:PLP-dependent aminotransferase family protein [Micromonospora sp. NPDC049101]|uniref:MocR-like pyridoxine biosynthesis transcription factor PdxR n=1 Tax=Micromonospora sp. NPDC049101 TaxID=3155032 RepID=UPI00340FF721
MTWRLFIHVDRSSGTPLTAQIHDAIQREITAGSLRPATRLPSSRQLAADLEVSRSVVVEAYDRLIAEGYLEAVRGSGTRVARHITPVSARPEPVEHAAAQLVRFDLRPDASNAVHFPHRDWLAAYDRAIRSVRLPDLDRPPPFGVPALRTELAGYLGRVVGVRACPGQTLVTAGFSAALRLLSISLRRIGIDQLGVEDPGHPRHRDIAARFGQRLYPVPVDASGINVRALARSGVRAVLTTPAHQFPTGVTMTRDRRDQLLRWAHDTGAWIIELDHDGDLWMEPRPRPLALQRESPDRVIYAGTASTILGPGLRVGWLCVPPTLSSVLDRVGSEREFAGDSLTQLAFAEFIRSGLLDRHARRMRARCRARREALTQAVGRHLPEARMSGSAAGLYAYLRLPAHIDEAALVNGAARRSVLVAGGRSCATAEPSPTAALVVGYAALPRSGLFEAIRVVGETAAELSGRPCLRHSA